jgi:CBS domain-containing protein
MARIVAKPDVQRDISSAEAQLDRSNSRTDDQLDDQSNHQSNFPSPVPSSTQCVADVMTQNPITVRPDTPLDQVMAILAQQQISGLPVLDQADRLVGVISEADLMWQLTGVLPPTYVTILDSVVMVKNPLSANRDRHRALGQTVGEVMTTPAISVAATATLPAAAQLMHDHRRLPVVDGEGHLVGIVTRSDIIRTMAAAPVAHGEQ